MYATKEKSRDEQSSRLEMKEEAAGHTRDGTEHYFSHHFLILRLSTSTLTLQFVFCDCRRQLRKSIPGDDGWWCFPVWGAKDLFTDLAKQGP